MTQPVGTARHRWALAIGWNVAVLVASFDGLSAAHTGGILLAVLHGLSLSLGSSTVGMIHLAIRKLAHLTEYGILGALYAHAQRTPEQEIFLLRWSVVAVAICFSTAVLDEWHQSFVPSRTGSAQDVAIDVIGAIVVQLLWAGLRWRARSRTLAS
jgi:VanZ family protein